MQKNTCKRLISDEKRILKKKLKKTKLLPEKLCPPYFHPNLWDGLLKFWNSECHKHRSVVGSQNRKKVDTLHSAGAKAFEAHEMARYGSILEEQGVNLTDMTPSSQLEEPIEWWLRATTGANDKPKKNRIVGFPTIPAGQLLSNLAHRFRENIRGGASSSSSSANRTSVIPDPLFLNIIRNAISSAQADLEQFGNLEGSELEEVARNLIEVSDPVNRGNFNTVFFREVVNVVSTIVTSICDNT